jgi:hypothetical protein
MALMGAPASLAQSVLRLKKVYQPSTRILFLRGQCGNVIENKGPLWKTQGRSWNVIENKGSYATKAGMLLKRKEVGGRWGRAGFGSQDSGGRRAGGRR